jgi:hypothetical protein
MRRSQVCTPVESTRVAFAGVSPHSPFSRMRYRYGSYRNNIFYFSLPGEYDVDMEALNKISTCNHWLTQICATNAAASRWELRRE